MEPEANRRAQSALTNRRGGLLSFRIQLEKQTARQIAFTPKGAKPPGDYSQTVKSAGLVLVSGASPTAPESGSIKRATIEEQTRQCLTNIAAIAEA